MNDLSFSPDLQRLVESGKFDGVQAVGCSTTNNLVIIRNLVSELRPTNTLETGLSYGASALAFTQTLKDLGQGHHTAIDPFQHEHVDAAALKLIERAGLKSYFTHINERSDIALPRLVYEGAKFDAIYVDGGHLFEDAFIDVHYSLRLLRIGGIMLLDDSTLDHVAKVRSFLRTNMRHCVRPVDLSPYRADKGRSLKYRLAKTAGRAQLTAFRKTADPGRDWNSKLGRF